MATARKPILGIASLTWVLIAWCIFLLAAYGPVSWLIANRVFDVMSIAAYAGGMPLAIGAFFRRERKLWPVLTIVLLAVSPVIMILLAILAWALV